MTKKLSIFLTLALVVALGISIFQNSHEKPSSLKSKSSKELYQSPAPVLKNLAKTPADLSSENTKVPSQCQKTWALLERVPSMNDLSNSDLLNKNCFQIGPDDTVKQQILAYCFSATLNEENQNACLSALILYRSRVIYTISKDEKNLKNLDSVTLINQIMALFTGAETFENFSDLVNRLEPKAEALLEKESNLYAAYKTVAMVRTIKAISADEDLNPAEKQRLDEEAIQIIEEAKRFDIDDEEMAAARWAIALKDGDLDAAEEMVDAYISLHPNSARAYYDKSQIYWKEKNRDQAKRYLERAQQLEPNHPTYQNTAEKLPNAKFDEMIYNFNMNVNYDQL